MPRHAVLSGLCLTIMTAADLGGALPHMPAATANSLKILLVVNTGLRQCTGRPLASFNPSPGMSAANWTMESVPGNCLPNFLSFSDVYMSVASSYGLECPNIVLRWNDAQQVSCPLCECWVSISMDLLRSSWTRHTKGNAECFKTRKAPAWKQFCCQMAIAGATGTDCFACQDAMITSHLLRPDSAVARHRNCTKASCSQSSLRVF